MPQINSITDIFNFPLSKVRIGPEMIAHLVCTLT